MIDWAVHMARLPDSWRADQRLARGQLDASAVDRIAEKLAEFHEAAEARSGHAASARVVGENLEENISSVGALLAAHLRADEADEVVRWQRAFYRGHRAQFEKRVLTGRMRDGHGDLHLSNTVVLGDDVTAFDCIEFDPALRCIDVIADIAFMTMDLHAHGRPDLAHRFLDAYLAASGDYEGLALLRFHEAARACVRGLV